MILNLEIIEKPIEIDDFMNEEEMGLSPFQFLLQELSQYVNGSINMSFNDIYCVPLDLFYDFSVCFDDIVTLVNEIKSNSNAKGCIWFCEQGSDFYFHYELKGDYIKLSYEKGSSVGNNHKDIPNFTVHLNKLEYVKEWERIFQELVIIFKEKFNRDIELPFMYCNK